jgi:hypothetical protein
MPGGRVFRQLARVLIAALVVIAPPTVPFAHAEGDQSPTSEPAITAPAPDVHTYDPSLPIMSLEPFQDVPSGLTGMRPSNWQFGAYGSTGFQSSSSLDAPDIFLGVFISREDAEKIAASWQVRTDCACRVVSQQLLQGLKRSAVEGSPPETLEQVTNDDGSAALLVETTTVTQTSRIPVRIIIYARTTINEDGLIFAEASIPADQFASEKELLRLMVDSVAFPENSTASSQAKDIAPGQP